MLSYIWCRVSWNVTVIPCLNLPLLCFRHFMAILSSKYCYWLYIISVISTSEIISARWVAEMSTSSYTLTLDFWPTILCKVAPLSQHVVCRLCDVLYCGLYDRQTADVWTYQGVFGDGRFNGTMQNGVGPTLVAMATKFGLKSPISRLVWQTDRRCLHLPVDFRGPNPSVPVY